MVVHAVFAAAVTALFVATAVALGRAAILYALFTDPVSVIWVVLLPLHLPGKGHIVVSN